MPWLRCGPLFVALALALPGCGSSTVKVTGELLKGGKPMVVSADTYVTLSFVREGQVADSERAAYTAKFDQATGTYSVELKPGNYKTKLVIAPPAPKGKFAAPGKPIDSPSAYDLTTSQKLDIEVPAK